MAHRETIQASHRSATLWATASLLASTGYLIFHGAPLTAGAPSRELVDMHSWAALPGRIMFLLAISSPLPMLIAAFSGLRGKASRAFWIRAALLVVTPWCSFIGARQLSWLITKSALLRSSAHSERLVDAINAFERRRGRPPASLEELDIQIPTTTIRAYPDYYYRCFKRSDRRIELWWYDLGTRSGRSITNHWRSTDGPIDHAVLVFLVHSDGRIAERFLDRMPVESLEGDFETEGWKRSVAGRIAMAKDLMEKTDLRTTDELIDQLGAPQGKRVLAQRAWELSIPSSPSELDDPSFFYWPTQNYPPHIDGAPVLRLGAWAYSTDRSKLSKLSGPCSAR